MSAVSQPAFDHVKFATEMKKRRIFYGYTHRALSEILGVSEVRIRNLECTTRRRPGVSDAACVCYLLNMNVLDYLDRRWKESVEGARLSYGIGD